jgi:uncharacterized MAPEG superfamily protein
MFILTTCLFVAAWFPFLSKIPLGLAMNKIGGYDNSHPRSQQKKLTGYGARTLAAHQNSYEALIIFGIAAVTAMATQNVTFVVDVLAITFVVSRVAYHVAYLMNLAGLRSLVWFVGFFSSMGILALSITF